MSFNNPEFVEIYEQIDGARTIDIPFYRQIAKEASGPVLEAGCGSGRILGRLMKDGIDVSGFDPSQPMLDVLATRYASKEYAAKGLKPKVWQGDFDSINGRFAAVISPFNSMMHLLKQEDQIDAMKRVYESLLTGGVFAFDVINPHTLDIYNDEREFETSMTDARTGQSIHIWRWFEHEPILQIGKYHREITAGEKVINSVIDFRWSYPTEIALLLSMAGFKSHEVFGGFEGESLTEESTSQVWIARK